jgi:hypothetical protein
VKKKIMVYSGAGVMLAFFIFCVVFFPVNAYMKNKPFEIKSLEIIYDGKVTSHINRTLVDDDFEVSFLINGEKYNAKKHSKVDFNWSLDNSHLNSTLIEVGSYNENVIFHSENFLGEVIISLEVSAKNVMKASLKVSISPPIDFKLKSIEVETPPSPNYFIEGETINNKILKDRGLLLNATFEDNGAKLKDNQNYVNDKNLSAKAERNNVTKSFESNRAIQTFDVLTNNFFTDEIAATPGMDIEIRLSYNGFAQTLLMPTNVVPKSLIDLKVLGSFRTEYIEGETFDRTGLIVVAVYEYSEIEVNDYSILESVLTPENKVITIVYGDDNYL